MEARLLAAALAHFELLELLEEKETFPLLPALDAATGTLLHALRQTRGLAWMPRGVVLGSREESFTPGKPAANTSKTNLLLMPPANDDPALSPATVTTALERIAAACRPQSIAAFGSRAWAKPARTAASISSSSCALPAPTLAFRAAARVPC